MASRTTFKEWRVAGTAALAATELSPLTDEALQRLLGPILESGESAPDLRPFQALVGRLLEHSASRLMQLEDHYAQVQLTERSRRDELVAAGLRLRQELVHARTLLRQFYGIGKGISVLGARVNLAAAAPLTLARVGRQLVDALRAPSFELPSPPAAVVQPPDPGALASAVEQALLPVEDLLAKHKPQHQVTEIGKGARDLERAELKDRVRRCSRFLEGLYQLAGLDYHAERLRAAARRRKAPETTEEEPPAGSDPAAGPAPPQQPKTGRRKRPPILNKVTAASAANDRGTHVA